MARQLKPCGTYAAYARHLRNGEKPCSACNEANNERAAAAPSGFNNYERQMTRALEANPPVIVWRKDKHGIKRHVFIDDPPAETISELRHQRQLEALARREREREIAAEQVEMLRRDMQDEADQVVERFRKHRAVNTPLMVSARRDI